MFFPSAKILLEMGKIRIPPQDTIKRIAAGEVIERPSSVVKELIENSLDAGAKRIIITLEEGGKKLIRVQDDGEGMIREDAEVCLKRYSTSKIRKFDDLLKLSTLGFRGEALPSIASVSQFSLLTKSKKELTGTLVSAEDGKIKSITEQASPEGTIATVRNLFFHTPARKKFLKSDSAELKHILNIVTKEALAHPKVYFQLSHNGKQTINTPSRNNYLDKIIDFWGKDFGSELIPLKVENSLLSFEGLICKPFFARKKSRLQYIFVNSRAISSRLIVAACKNGYQPVVPEERYPQVFLFFKINPDEIDVNIHPSKDIIKFHKENEIFQIVSGGVRECLKNAELLPEIFFKKKHLKGRVAPKISRSFYLGKEDKIPIKEKNIKLDFSGIKKPSVKEKEEDYVIGTENLSIKAQINNTYLLGEDEEGFFMLDQHAVHERILYEKLKKEIKNSKIQVQNMLLPETLELSKNEASVINEYLDILKKMGFGIEIFGDNTFIINSVPKIIKKTSPSVILLDIAEEIDNMGKTTSIEERTEKILTMVACKSAIKAGDKLKKEEIESLISQWEATDYKNWCPHGRPAVIRFSWKEIEKKFNRRV
jgi:DNA mismatch repair protein MutL